MNKHITPTQLRIARHSLGIGTRELAKLLIISKSCVSRAELNRTRDFFPKNNFKLLDYFEKNEITFPTEYSIRYGKSDTQLELSSKEPVEANEILTRFQIKVARHLLNLKQVNLAEDVGVPVAALKKLESKNNISPISSTKEGLNSRFISVFNQQGIIFPDSSYVYYKEL